MLFVLAEACVVTTSSGTPHHTGVWTSAPPSAALHTSLDDSGLHSAELHTGPLPPSGPPAPRSVPAVAPWGTLEIPTVPYSPDVTGIAITDGGSLCVSGSSWFEGYGSTAVDQYAPGAARLTRIDPTGALDLGFGTAGVAVIPETSGGLAVAAAPGDGCYLTVGFFDAVAYAPEAATVVRVRRNGTVDPSFASPRFHQHGPPETIHALAALADGGLMLLGTGATSAYVARLRSDGVLDPDWGVRGEVVLPGSLDCVSTSFCDWGALAVLADGSVLASVGHPATVTKLDPTGALDLGWGTSGTATPSGAFRVRGLAAAADGGVVLAGAAHDGVDDLPRLERLDAGGGQALGPVWIPVGPGYATVHDVALDAADRPILAARVGAPALVRTAPDGVLDPAWDGDGVWTYGPATASSAEMDAVELAADGTIVAAGVHLGLDRMVVVALAP